MGRDGSLRARISFVMTVFVLPIILFACGGKDSQQGSNSPDDVAKLFIERAIAADFEGVKSLYAPDRQPDSWQAVVSLGPSVGDARGCEDVPFQTVERDGNSSEFVTVSFAFETDCYAMRIGEAADAPVVGTENVVNVLLEQINDRWYVSYVST